MGTGTWTGRKLALTLAFTVLVAVAFGVSCRGFFPPNTLTAVSIQPPTPQVEIGSTTTVSVQAWGTYMDGTRSQITSGVAWTSAPSSIVEILGPCATQECGSATLQGVASGTAQITAAAQGLSATATATAYLGNVTSFEVCMGTFGDTTSCSSGSTPLTWNPDATNEVNQNFIAQGTSNGEPFDLTTAATWTVAPTPVAGSIECDNTNSPAICTVDEGTTASPPTYVITVTYGANPTLTATVNVTVTN